MKSREPTQAAIYRIQKRDRYWWYDTNSRAKIESSSKSSKTPRASAEGTQKRQASHTHQRHYTHANRSAVSHLPNDSHIDAEFHPPAADK